MAELGLLCHAAAVEKQLNSGFTRVVLGEVDAAVVGLLASVSGHQPPCQPLSSSGSPAQCGSVLSMRDGGICFQAPVSVLSASSVEPFRKVEGATGIPNPANWPGSLGGFSSRVKNESWSSFLFWSSSSSLSC